MKVRVRTAEGLQELCGDQVLIRDDDDTPIIVALKHVGGSIVVAVAGDTDFERVMSLLGVEQLGKIIRLELPKAGVRPGT